MRVESARAGPPDISSPDVVVAMLDRATLQPPPIVPDRPHLPAFEFSTREVPREHQFEAWRTSFKPMLEFADLDGARAGFDGEQVIWDLGSLAFSRIRTGELDFASLPGHVRRDPLDHWLMTLLLDGHATTTAPTRTFKGGAGVVQVHPLGQPFDGHVTDSEMLMLFVPRDFCRDMALALDAVEFTTLETGMGRLFADYLTDLAKRLPMLDAADLPGLVAATRAMILACASPSPDHLEEAQDPIATVLLERARRLVQANLFDPELGIDMLLRELGISRTRLYRLFEPSGGVMRYVQRRRLLNAHSALADPTDHRRIFEIAEQRGFGDGAEFSRAFKREFGYSPSEVRMSGKDGVSSRLAAGLDATAPEERLGQILRRLQG